MPRLIPVMLIHGLNGQPSEWQEKGFVRALVEGYDLDPELIHLFHYGWTEDGAYDNQGDIRRIASRLTYRESERPEDLRSQVLRLSQKSVARGGPPEVTIIAHSMGGLVTRYWMSRREPDEFGAHFDAPVARLITIATPHQGVDLLAPEHLIESDDPILRIARFIERLPWFKGRPATALQQADAEVMQLQEAAIREAYPELSARGVFDSPALRQLRPGSQFMRQLNRPQNWPPGVEAVLLWGDVRYGAALRARGLLLWERMTSWGDLLVSAGSASTLRGVDVVKHPFVNETRWELSILEPAPMPALEARAIPDYLPPEYHSNLLRNPRVHEVVGQILAGSVNRDRLEED